ncbi:MAG: hypothetical protein DHS20C14_06300 [Phycisphaeraceae bacterium]|nr:MAG: hypothetical protein DHS20C14_06300 [Phycisphaeraceae bacterium]
MLRTTTVGLCAAMLTTSALGAPIPREGSGERRDAMNAMEAAPLPRDAFDSLDAWVGMDELRVRDLRGGVTVIVTTDVADADSIRYTRELAALAARHDGVTIFAIHPEAGWDRFELLQDAGMVKVPGARDTGNALRELLHADENADLFVIDKAGNLRYADAEPIGLERAVVELLDETAEHAAGEQARRTEMIAAGESPYGPTRAEKIDLPAPEDMTSGMLAKHLYADADWPERNVDFGANDLQGQELPSMDHVTWISERYTDIDNKVIILDFWATWCGPCIRAMPTLQNLQKSYHKDLMVVGVGGQSEEELKVRDWVKKKGEHYAHVYDGRRRIINKFAPQGIPFVVVASTDGVVRWTGNPHEEEFVEVVHQVIASDPLVRARNGTLRLTADDIGYMPAAGSGELDWPEACSSRTRYSENDMHEVKLDDVFGELAWLDGQRAPETEGKVVVLDFWATWCGPCKKFSPRLDALQRKHADDIVAVAISGQGEERETVEKYLESHGSAYRHAFSEEQELYETIGVKGIPHVVILSSDGIVRWHGFPNGVDDFEAVVEQVIAANKELAKIATAP